MFHVKGSTVKVVNRKHLFNGGLVVSFQLIVDKEKKKTKEKQVEILSVEEKEHISKYGAEDIGSTSESESEEEEEEEVVEEEEEGGEDDESLDNEFSPDDLNQDEEAAKSLAPLVSMFRRGRLSKKGIGEGGIECASTESSREKKKRKKELEYIDVDATSPEQGEEKHKSGEKKKKKKQDKPAAPTHADSDNNNTTPPINENEKILLYGELVEEITSPLIVFELTITPSPQNSKTKEKCFNVKSVDSAQVSIKKITLSSIKKKVLETGYFGTNREWAGKEVEIALAPSKNSKYGLKANDLITDSGHLSCITDLIMKCALKNLFTDPQHYYRHVSALGPKLSKLMRPIDLEELRNICSRMLDLPEEEGTSSENQNPLYEKMKLLLFSNRSFSSNELCEVLMLDQNHLPLEVAVIHKLALKYHELNEKSKFGSTALFIQDKAKLDEGIPDEKKADFHRMFLHAAGKMPDKLKLMSDFSFDYILQKKTVFDSQVKLAKLLQCLEKFLVVEAENDCGHQSAKEEEAEDPTNYFTYLSKESKRNAVGISKIITTTNKRIQYLKLHSGWNVISESTNKLNGPGTTDALKKLFESQTLLVDRSHLLSLEDLMLLLKQFFGMKDSAPLFDRKDVRDMREKKKVLILCGSTLCKPEGEGQPFADLYDNVASISNRLQLKIKYDESKIRGYYNDLDSIFEFWKKSKYILTPNP